MTVCQLLSTVLENVENDHVLCILDIKAEEIASGKIPLKDNQTVQLSSGLWSYLKFEQNFICDGELNNIRLQSGSEYTAICSIYNSSGDSILKLFKYYCLCLYTSLTQNETISPPLSLSLSHSLIC